jgi:hypothetical protein
VVILDHGRLVTQAPLSELTATGGGSLEDIFLNLTSDQGALR